MNKEISFRRWCIRKVWGELKEFWFVWFTLFSFASIFALSGSFLPDLPHTNTFIEKGFFGLLSTIAILLSGILVFKLIVVPIKDYRKELLEKYEEEIGGKKTGDP